MGTAHRSVGCRLFALLACMVVARAAVAAIGIDATVFKDQGSSTTTVTTPTFSTHAGNQLLLAFVSTDNVTAAATRVNGISGGGLAWTLVIRNNTQRGTAEIWRATSPIVLNSISVTATLSQAVNSSMTVITFTGADLGTTNGIGATASGSGATGAPTATLVTTRNGSLVVGVGVDWDNPIARTVGAGQTLIHQYLAPVGDTYWVQRQTNSNTASGTTVTINDTAPTTDRYNLALVEILALGGGGGATFAISGSISPSASASGTTLTLAQSGSTVATVIADGSGSYSFAGLSNGTYLVTPVKSGFTFSPTSQTAVVNGANVTLPAFAATPAQAATLLPDLQNIIPTDRFTPPITRPRRVASSGTRTIYSTEVRDLWSYNRSTTPPRARTVEPNICIRRAARVRGQSRRLFRSPVSSSGTPNTDTFISRSRASVSMQSRQTAGRVRPSR